MVWYPLSAEVWKKLWSEKWKRLYRRWDQNQQWISEVGIKQLVTSQHHQFFGKKVGPCQTIAFRPYLDNSQQGLFHIFTAKIKKHKNLPQTRWMWDFDVCQYKPIRSISQHKVRSGIRPRCCVILQFISQKSKPSQYSTLDFQSALKNGIISSWCHRYKLDKGFYHLCFE